MTHRRRLTALLLTLGSALAGFSGTGAFAAQSGGPAIELVTLPSESPLVAIRLLFDAGSIYDPAGKEGLAALTALMVSQGSTQKRSYGDLLEALYPMAASIGSNTDREVTLFTGTVHRETLADYAKLLQESLLQPAFTQSDLDRNREQLVSAITNGLRSNDELLGLEVLQDEIFAGHPYGHASVGTVEALKSITLDDVKAFYRDRYTQAGLMLGVAGGYPQSFPAELARAFSALPAGQKGKARRELPPIPKVQGRPITFIEKETGSVGITLGHALAVTRADPDYYPLMVANSYLGEHRSMFGRLMNQLRVVRGLNYGDYSYIEYYFYPPGTNYPTASVPRRQQYFSIWIRPLVPADAQFALRAALFELKRLHDEGMKKEDFETTRGLLLNYTNLWAQSPSDRLGYLMDSKFYGTPFFPDEIQKHLKTVTLEQVNAAVKKHLDPDNWHAVIVTNNAGALAETLRGDAPSPKSYTSPPPPRVAEEDKTITTLPVKPTAVEILSVEQVFQK